MSDEKGPLVLDASAALDFLLQLRSAHRIGALITDASVALHAPDTVDREVISTLRRLERTGDLKPDDAQDAIHDFTSLSLELHPSRPHIYRVWGLRAFVSVGDAYYVALAEALNATLVTTDAKLARGLSSVDVRVLVP